jgi:hypothetical protein
MQFSSSVELIKNCALQLADKLGECMNYRTHLLSHVLGLLLQFFNREMGRNNAKEDLGCGLGLIAGGDAHAPLFFPGEACITWFLEFETWSLMPLGVWVLRHSPGLG